MAASVPSIGEKEREGGLGQMLCGEGGLGCQRQVAENGYGGVAVAAAGKDSGLAEFNGESATCDLVTAARIRIRGRPVPVFHRGWVFDVLYAYQDDKSTPARLVLAGPGWYLLTGPQFRRLTEIIETRHDAGDRPVRGIIRTLNRMATDQEAHSQPWDWSFRTDPQGLQRNEESK